MNFSLFKAEPQYRKLFVAGIVNGVGDRFSQVAMLTMLLQLTGSGFAVGVTMALRLLPFLTFGPLGGRLADRFSRKRILIITDLVRVIFALSFLLVNSKDDIWIIYIGSFVLAAGEAIYAPTRKATIPRLIKKEHLVKVNGLEQVMIGIVLIGGAFSGGVVSYLFGPNISFMFNGASFLIAAWLISSIVFPEALGGKRSQGESANLSMLKKVLLASVPLQIILLGECLIPLINGIDNVLISVYAVNIFKLGDMGVGLFYGALGIGLVFSFVIANRLKSKLLLIGFHCLMLEGVSLAMLSQSSYFMLALLFFCCTAFMSGIGNTCFDTVLMREVPDKLQGTIFGIIATISNTLLGISMFLAGVALEFIYPRTLGLIGGLSFIIIAILLTCVLTIKKSISTSLEEKSK